MQDQFRALSGNISSEHALSAQINDLREVRTTVRERLQATESSLADARQEVIALRFKDQEQSRRIVDLETNAARAQSQPAETPLTLLRIQELDCQNRGLQSEIVTLRKEATDLSSQVHQSSTEAREVAERLATTQEQLEAAREETTRLREEKSTSERQAMFEREQLRKELSKTVNMQLASMQSKHMNVVQQLRLEKSPAEEKLKGVNRQVNMLKVEKQRLEKETAQSQTLLKGERSDKEALIGARKALELHLKEMEVRMHEKDNYCGDAQAMLNKANGQIKARDLEIIALKASQAKRPSSSRVLEQSNPVRGAQLTRNGRALYRDPQQASIGQSPSIRPTKSKSSRQFTDRPAVVEDSQPTEKPSFVSLDELMLEDPFAGYAQDGSQTIAGEDISNLFPSTPGAGSRAKDLDYSRRSKFHTPVVSEIQRGQHQLSREGKRNAVAAGFKDTSSHFRPGKVPKIEPSKRAKNLGPVVEDSQSPLLNGGGRKMASRKSSAPKGKPPTQSPI